MATITTKKSQNVSKDFLCEKCNYSTSRNSDYKKHIRSAKHNNTTNYNKLQQNYSQKKNICDCGKQYNHRASLYNHRKKCNNTIVNIENNSNNILNNADKDQIIETLIKENSDFKNIITELVKSNNDLQLKVLDICKTIQPSNNHSYNNNNNKTFNLQFFLNEQCKDAMNITDFANSITLQLKDLENIGSTGYVNGISSIIIKELKGLDITKRPVHCSDVKRETLYIKDENKWEKECPENTKMKKVIRNVEKKNINLISEWTDKNPDYYNTTTNENNEYLKIMKETMGGKGDYEANTNKIIKKIAKEVVIDKI